MDWADYNRLREAGYTKEQIAEAKQMSTIEYMQRYMPQELVRCSRGEYEMRSHDSFKINEHTSKWHWKSRGIGGRTALDFLISVMEVPPETAIRELLNGEPPTYAPREEKPIEKKPFTLPERSPTPHRVREYLSGRGISETVIAYCLQQGNLYEDLPYHNAVFVGFDKHDAARYAFKRGTLPPSRDADGNMRKPYKAEVPGSEKSFAFYMEPPYKSDTLAIYESAIEAMSHVTILEDAREPWKDCYRLALGGIVAPKEGVAYRNTSYRAMPGPLMQFLKDHQDIRKIQVCLNNDYAGRFAADRIMAHYQEQYEMEYLPPDIEGDYNDLAVRQMQNRQENHEGRKDIIRPALTR